MKRLMGLGVLAILTFLFCVPQAAQAQASKKVVADLSEDFIGVREGFNGARLTVFGALKNRADVAIVLEGPPAQAQVRMKTRWFGLWVNGTPRKIAPVPSFYAVVSSRPIEAIASDELARAYGLLPAYLPFGDAPHGAGLVEAKRAQGLYQFAPQGVRTLENKLFRADIHLPANVPIGAFKVHIYEFSGKKLIASRSETLQVAQVGFNDTLSRMAHNRPELYAVLCLVVALSIGGFGVRMSRKT